MTLEYAVDPTYVMACSLGALANAGKTNVSVNIHPRSHEEWKEFIREAEAWHRATCIERHYIKPGLFITEIYTTPADMGTLRKVVLFDW